MEKNIIKLGTEVMVSDPCYVVGTWCQTLIRGVLPGNYEAWMTGIMRLPGWGLRNSGICVVHEHALLDGKPLTFKKHSTIGVDSGQAGIFDLASYRAGDHTDNRVNGTPAELWYDDVARLTLDTGDNWGCTDTGIISRSGVGDGMYTVLVAKKNRMIVGISIDFSITKTQKAFIQTLQEA